MKRTLLASVLLLVMLATMSSAIVNLYPYPDMQHTKGTSAPRGYAIISVKTYIGTKLSPAWIDISEANMVGSNTTGWTQIGQKNTSDGLMNIYVKLGKSYWIHAKPWNPITNSIDSAKDASCPQEKVDGKRQVFLYMTGLPLPPKTTRPVTLNVRTYAGTKLIPAQVKLSKLNASNGYDLVNTFSSSSGTFTLPVEKLETYSIAANYWDQETNTVSFNRVASCNQYYVNESRQVYLYLADYE